MSRGVLMLAQNGHSDYVQQACLNAMSIVASSRNVKVSLVTNDEVPEKYVQFFDEILPIPWNDSAKHSFWKIENRWKLYHVTPYDKTIVMDTDMLTNVNINDWWDFLDSFKVFYTTEVYNYRNEIIKDEYYRKTFIANKLPNLYSGIHYFEKSYFAYEYYTWLEQCVKNWEDFYKKHAPKKYQKMCSIDVSSSICAKILDIEKNITSKNSDINFVHLKPHNQGWTVPCDRWQDRLGVYLEDDLSLTIGNYKQDKILHYTENDFVTEKIIQKYERYLDV